MKALRIVSGTLKGAQLVFAMMKIEMKMKVTIE